MRGAVRQRRGAFSGRGDEARAARPRLGRGPAANRSVPRAPLLLPLHAQHRAADGGGGLLATTLVDLAKQACAAAAGFGGAAHACMMAARTVSGPAACAVLW